MTDIYIRPLEPSEWEAVRAIRLDALKTEPKIFYHSFEKEVAFPPDHWQRIVSAPTHQIFGLFDKTRLIGITAAWPDELASETVRLGMSFILPEYRRRGLSQMLYEVRFAWIKDRPQFKRIIVSHRASNEVSRRANQRHGFVETDRKPRLWPDGETEDDVSYELANVPIQMP